MAEQVFSSVDISELENRIAQKVLAGLSKIINAPKKEEDVRMDPDEASTYTGLAKQTIYQKASERLIPSHKIGGKLRFLKSELDDWMKSNSRKVRQSEYA